ncbi:unnamed protein product [Malus baccata var. baccata]
MSTNQLMVKVQIRTAKIQIMGIQIHGFISFSHLGSGQDFSEFVALPCLRDPQIYAVPIPRQCTKSLCDVKNVYSQDEEKAYHLTGSVGDDLIERITCNQNSWIIRLRLPSKCLRGGIFPSSL